MKFDFTVPMTFYEFLAIILGGIAILIPIIQWAWRKWITKPVLKFLPTGRAFLFINKSGSYIQIEDVYEALNKAITVKNIMLKIKREKDDKILNLRWSTFTSPMNQKIAGNFASTTEIAHPFRIEANSIACAFTEFSDFYDSSFKTLQPFFDALEKDARDICVPNLLFGEEVLSKFKMCDSYKAAEMAIEKELFWQIGKYSMILEVEHDGKIDTFNYKFSVNNDEYIKIKCNMSETLLAVIKGIYQIPYAFQTVQVEIQNL